MRIYQALALDKQREYFLLHISKLINFLVLSFTLAANLRFLFWCHFDFEAEHSFHFFIAYFFKFITLFQEVLGFTYLYMFKYSFLFSDFWRHLHLSWIDATLPYMVIYYFNFWFTIWWTRWLVIYIGIINWLVELKWVSLWVIDAFRRTN